MITGIERLQQAIGMLRVACDHIEVDDRVEMPGRANPLVHCLAIGFDLGSRMVKLGANERQNRRANRLDTMRMRARNHLLVRSSDAVNHRVVFRARVIAFARHHAEIVHALQHDQVATACGREHIVIEARQRIRTKAVEQQSITANSGIYYSEVCRSRIRLQALRQQVGPAIVAVRCCAVSISDRIAESNNCGSLWRSCDFDSGDEVPVLERLCRSKIGGRDLIAVN